MVSCFRVVVVGCCWLRLVMDLPDVFVCLHVPDDDLRCWAVAVMLLLLMSPSGTASLRSSFGQVSVLDLGVDLLRWGGELVVSVLFDRLLGADPELVMLLMLIWGGGTYRLHRQLIIRFWKLVDFLIRLTTKVSD